MDLVNGFCANERYGLGRVFELVISNIAMLVFRVAGDACLFYELY